MPDDKKPDPKPIPAGLAYSTIGGVRNTEAHLRWTGAALSAVLNLPGLVGVAFRLVAKLEPTELGIIMVGSAIFIIANLFVFHILRRDGKYLELWNDKLDELERVNKIEGGVEIFSSRRYRRLRSSRERLQARLEWAMIACIVMWVIAGVVSSITLVTTKGVLS